MPDPNNLATTFVETPAFPRIDMWSESIATRGNHQPVWRYLLGDGTETRVGTTGIYANPFGSLITAAGKLGDVPDFAFLAVPEFPGTRFEVFPGAPAVTDADTIVFKGNYTVDLVGRTGVYYRRLAAAAPAGGAGPVVLIANNTDTMIPGTDTVFGSTAPPSAADGKIVFAGFDDEGAPTMGGLYLAPLEPEPPLTTLVGIGDRVPGGRVDHAFTRFGEGVTFDGRFVGFWGAWGAATETVRLYCPAEGNRDRIDYCNQALVCADTGETLGDPNSVCDDLTDRNFGISCYQDKQVPTDQGIFVHDTDLGRTLMMARSGVAFDDFVFWTYSGKAPCVGGGHGHEGAEDDGEPARWRSSAFIAISGGRGAAFKVAFKARTGDLVDGVYFDPVDGIYLGRGPGRPRNVTVLDTTMPGQYLDPEAPAGSTITELGIERESLRGDWLAVNAGMGVEGGTEEEGLAGIYVTEVR